MTTMRWESFADDVERQLPELGPRFSRMRPLWDDEPIPSHIVVGDIIVPALVGALDKLEFQLVERLVDLLTSLAESNDSRLNELVMVSFVEFVIGDPSLEKRLQPHFSELLVSLVKQRKNWKAS